MQFHQINYFLAACDTMNFTRASEICNVSQPALTVAIRKLEEELGGALFDRDARQLRLTELGRSMRTHLARLQEAKNVARLEANKIVYDELDMIDIGIMCTVGPRFLSKGISKWNAETPNSELVLHDVWGDKALDLLLTGSIDCALMACTKRLPDRFEVYPLLEERMVIAVPPGHEFLKKSEVGLEEVSEVPYVDRLRCEFRSEIYANLQDKGLYMKVAVSSEREDWLCEAIKLGMGVATMPVNMAIYAGLDYVEIKDTQLLRSIELITISNRVKRTPVQSLIDHFMSCDWSQFSS